MRRATATAGPSRSGPSSRARSAAPSVGRSRPPRSIAARAAGAPAERPPPSTSASCARLPSGTATAAADGAARRAVADLRRRSTCSTRGRPGSRRGPTVTFVDPAALDERDPMRDRRAGTVDAAAVAQPGGRQRAHPRHAAAPHRSERRRRRGVHHHRCRGTTRPPAPRRRASPATCAWARRSRPPWATATSAIPTPTSSLRFLARRRRPRGHRRRPARGAWPAASPCRPSGSTTAPRPVAAGTSMSLLIAR